MVQRPLLSEAVELASLNVISGHIVGSRGSKKMLRIPRDGWYGLLSYIRDLRNWHRLSRIDCFERVWPGHIKGKLGIILTGHGTRTEEWESNAY